MKSTLQSQLDAFKNDNTEATKEALMSTLNSITGATTNNVSALASVKSATNALSSSNTNKNDVVQSVENVISSLT